MNKRISNCR